MKQWMVLILTVAAIGCGGSLSKEQREEMKEAREAQAIKRVTEAELIEEATKQGRKIIGAVVNRDSLVIDSLAVENKVKIKWLTPGTSDALEIEKQIIDAYVMSAVTGDLPENVQKMGEDSLLYSKPVVEKLPDGAVQVEGVWSVLFSKKQLILGMD